MIRELGGRAKRQRQMKAPPFLTILVPAGLALLAPAVVQAQALPALPDSSGWGVHVLAVTRDPDGGLWVGTYGQGIFRLRPKATAWERIRHDSTATSISWDFVHAFAFGPRGEIWYGTVGNGWGLSRDSGATWTNWTFSQLGPEWQYVAPDGIVVHGDTTWVGTADGIQMTTDDGAHWMAIEDSIGPPAKGPADSVIPLLGNEYVRRLGLDRTGLLVTTLKGSVRLTFSPAIIGTQPVAYPVFSPRNRILMSGVPWRGTSCGLRPVADTLPCIRKAVKPAEDPRPLRTNWFRRPIDRTDNPFIDQTYRYGSTMGGNFQQHQGVEFNNPDGTPVMAIGGGTVVYAGPAEQGALTVAIRHDSTLATSGGRLRIFSVYYHNSAIKVRVGQRVQAGQVISLVGNTGRATNDHLHLEVHAAPTDDVKLIVDSLERFPPYTTNPELWIEPLPNTGIVAGQVFDAAGKPVPQARIYGLIKPEPVETPFSYAETYGDKAHPHPLYGEHFAVSDVPPGDYFLGTEIGGKKVYRKATVEAGKLTWVVFRP
ncbi:MAG TPA: M23 family metallopeptidase [Gemmatimonadales bacterium]|nr:M23 family metallopeptidase [Gemmatimonadales bacterium]